MGPLCLAIHCGCGHARLRPPAHHLGLGYRLDNASRLLLQSCGLSKLYEQEVLPAAYNFLKLDQIHLLPTSLQVFPLIYKVKFDFRAR